MNSLEPDRYRIWKTWQINENDFQIMIDQQIANIGWYIGRALKVSHSHFRCVRSCAWCVLACNDCNEILAAPLQFGITHTLYCSAGSQTFILWGVNDAPRKRLAVTWQLETIDSRWHSETAWNNCCWRAVFGSQLFLISQWDCEIDW